MHHKKGMKNRKEEGKQLLKKRLKIQRTMAIKKVNKINRKARM